MKRKLLEIRCHKVSDEVREIVSFIKSRQGMISGKIDGNICEIPILDIYYFESVDKRSFAYTASDNYEINMRIYELEELAAVMAHLSEYKREC